MNNNNGGQSFFPHISKKIYKQQHGDDKLSIDVSELGKQLYNRPVIAWEVIKNDAQDKLDSEQLENICSDVYLKLIKNEKWDRLLAFLLVADKIGDITAKLDVSQLFASNSKPEWMWKLHLAFINRDRDYSFTENIRQYICDNRSDFFSRKWAILQAIYAGKHFLSSFFENKTSINSYRKSDLDNNLRLCKVFYDVNVNHNFESVEENANSIFIANHPEIMKSYFYEIQRQTYLLQVIARNKDIFQEFRLKEELHEFISTPNIIEMMALGTTHSNLIQNIKSSIVKELIRKNHEYKMKILESTKKIPSELSFYNKICIILDCLELIFMDLELADYKQRMHSLLDRIKINFRNIDNLQEYIDTLETCFSLLFLRDESHHSHKKHYLCPKTILESLLSLLKFCTTQKRHTLSYMNDDQRLKARFDKILSYINDGIWRFTLLNNSKHAVAVENNIILTKQKTRQELVLPYKTIEDNLSSEDENRALKASYHQATHRRKPRKRGGSQHHSENDKANSFNQTNTESDQHYLEEKNSPATTSNIITKMVGSVENLTTVCLNRGDIDAVREIIKIYKLENYRISDEIRYLDEATLTKVKLKDIFEKYDMQESSPVTDQSTIEIIKTVAAVGLEATKITNIIENFIANHRIVPLKETLDLLNKYKTTYPWLAEYLTESNNIMYIMDFMLSLASSYETGLILLNLMGKYCETMEEKDMKQKSSVLGVVGCYGFAKKLVQCLHVYKRFRGVSVGVKDMLSDEWYSFDVDELVEKLELEANIEKFKKHPNADLSDILSWFNKDEGSGCVNYFQRISQYCDNARQLLTFKPEEPLLDCNKLLEYDYNHILGDLVFLYKIAPEDVEEILTKMNINIRHALISNCLEPIFIHQKVDQHVLDDLEANLLNSNYQDIISLEKRHYYGMTDSVLEYIHDNNFIVSFLLSKIFQLKFNHSIDNGDDELSFTICERYFAMPQIHSLEILFFNNSVLAALNYDEIQCDRLARIMLDSSVTLREKYQILSSLKEWQLRTQYKTVFETIVSQLAESACGEFEDIILLEAIRDLNKRATILLNILESIKSNELVERLIKGILTDDRVNTLDATLLQKLCDTLNNLKIYCDIANALKISWCNVKAMSTEKPDVLLQSLLSHKLYKLGELWSKLHPLMSAPSKLSNFTMNFAIALRKLRDDPILPSYLENSQQQQHDIFKLIETLPTATVCRFYRKMIPQLKHTYLIDYMLSFLLKHDEQSADRYQIYQISICIFKNLTESEIIKLWSLFSRPLLIIEQLLMNAKFDALQKVISAMQPLLFRDRCCKICHANKIRDGDDNFRYYYGGCEDFMAINIDYNHNRGEIMVECIDALLRIYAANSLDFRVIENQTTGEFLCGSNEQISLDSLYGAFVLPRLPPKKEDWIRDEDATHCMCCRRAVFTMLTRRHHCRRCGRVVCHSCSTYRMKVPSMYNDILVRVCTDCWSQEEKAPIRQQGDNEDPNTITTPNSSSSSQEWKLYGSMKHDHSVRDEFCFEYAPSVPLCLSILSSHSKSPEYSAFLLYHCRKFEHVLKPLQPGYPNPEVDYILVTRILHCLALAAKVRGGPDECNTIIDHADIILSVVQHGCEALLPMEALNTSSLRKLRDSLVIAEKWDLALDLSFKWGYSSTGVMAAWGITCLRAGCYETARDKFAHCLAQIITEETTKMILSMLDSTDKLKEFPKMKRPLKSPPLLYEIIQILELTYQPASPDVLARAAIIKNSNTSLASGKSQKKITMPTHEPALNILHTLENLKQISQGKFEPETDTTSGKKLPRKDKKIFHSEKSVTSTRYYEESMFYLITYGSHTDIIEFLIKHNQINYALRYIARQAIDPEIFVNSIYLPHLKTGQVEPLINQLIVYDESLVTFQTYIIYTCRYLETKSMFNCLYQLQLLLKDPVRASMTCVKFYSMSCSSFQELKSHTHHLKNAQMHLESELELCQKKEMNNQQQKHEAVATTNKEATITMKMDSKSLNNHITTILQQIEVTKFLAKCEEDRKDPVGVLHKIFGSSSTASAVPTLFDTTQGKIQLCVLLLICGKNIEEGFGLTYRIMHYFNLSSMKIYAITARHLSSNSRILEVEKLIACIKCNNGTEQTNYDELIMLAIETAVETYGMQIKSSVDTLFNLLVDVAMKINCYIVCGQLKSAYLLAVQSNRINDIKRIKRQAELSNQGYIIKLCEKKLKSVKL